MQHGHRGRMQSDSLGSALATVAACGGVGAFIDFWIGQRGQRRVRDWLETWWLRFSDVRWDNFGREEALFAVRIMDRLFGRRLLSFRRLTITTLSIFASLGLVSFLVFASSSYEKVALFLTSHWSLILSSILIYFMSLPVAISIARLAAVGVSSIFNKPTYINPLGFILLLLFQYGLFCLWTPALSFIHWAESFMIAVAIMGVHDMVFYPISAILVDPLFFIKDYFSIYQLSPVYQINIIINIFSWSSPNAEDGLGSFMMGDFDQRLSYLSKFASKLDPLFDCSILYFIVCSSNASTPNIAIFATLN
jgi:hypothetical protein